VKTRNISAGFEVLTEVGYEEFYLLGYNGM
jgi:hypothetical protein